MMKMRSTINIINEDQERLINNININLIVGEQSTSFISDNNK